MYENEALEGFLMDPLGIPKGILLGTPKRVPFMGLKAPEGALKGRRKGLLKEPLHIHVRK